MRILRSIFTGILAGVISAYSFALIHGTLISDIWFSLPILLLAGAICGLCLGWTYGMLIETPSIHTWLQFNALYLGMFVLIGVVSVLVYEPVTTIASLMLFDGPPTYLFRQAMPMTIASTIVTTAIIGRLYARTWVHYAAILVTCAVLVSLLGLNVSVIGLISIPHSSVYLIMEVVGLLLALNVVFAIVFAALQWKSFFSGINRFHLFAGRQ